MANQTLITAMLRLVSTGVKETVKETAQINSNLKGAADQAERLSKTRAPVNAARAPGGTSGSRQASQAPAPGQELQEYGRSRGMTGSTGAAGRDFANQAQGLGGIVRLYATYAANVFAVGAAFRALSGAMDTSNMVKGLDQLGAASGQALGTLSVRLAKATDGAISLREAMEATVKASSSGMNSDQIMRMGQVAKQASLALGVDMGDAISRISRGITKLEPELLDELGIFTRLDPAVRAYANSVGKSVSSLTDFERRMAFANAVLEEGESKFGEIELAANSYSKLLATIKDQAFKALDAINTVLGPVINLLSQSPAALVAGISALAGVVIRQAVPALGQLRENLEAVAKQSASDAYNKAQLAQTVQEQAMTLELRKVEEGADAKLAAVEKAEADIAKAKFTGARTSKEVEKLLATDIQDIRQKDYDDAINKAKLKEEQALKYEQSGKRGSAARAAAAREEAVRTRNLVKELREHQAAEEALQRARTQATESVRSGGSAWTVLGQNIRLAQAEQEASSKKSIISNASYNASLIGLRGSWILMNEQIAKSGLQLNAFGMAALKARAAMGILTGAVATFGAALMKALNIIGIIVTAFSLLNAFLSGSKTGKALSAYSDSLDVANKSAETFTATMEKAYGRNMLNIKSLEAQSSALNELSSSLVAAAKAGEKAQDAMKYANLWNKGKEAIFSFFGSGIEDKFRETLTEGIVSAIDGLSASKEADEVRAELSKIYNIDPKSTDLQDAIRKKIAELKLTPDSRESKESIALLEQLALKTGIAAGKAREFKDALAGSSDAYKTLADKFKAEDPLVSFAEANILALKKLEANLQESDVSKFAENILELTEDLAKNPIFGPEQSLALSSYNKNLQKLNKDLQESKTRLKDLQELDPLKNFDEEAVFQQILGSGPNRAGKSKEAREQAQAYGRALSESYKASVKETKDLISFAEKGISNIGKKIRDGIDSGIKYNIDTVIIQLQKTLVKGSTEFLQSALSKLSSQGFAGAAALEGKLKQEELSIERQSIASMRDLISAMQLNTAASVKETALREKQEATAAYYSLPSDAPTDKRKAAESRVVTATYDYDQAEKNFNLISKAVKDPIGALTDLRNTFGTVSKDIAANVMDFSQRMAGFTQALSAVDAKKQQEALKTSLDTINEQYTGVAKIYQIEKDSLANDKKSLQARTDSRELTADQAILESKALSDKEAQLELEESIRKSGQEYANAMAYVNILRNSKDPVAKQLGEEFALSAQILYTQKSGLAISVRDYSLKEASLKATAEQRKLDNDRFSAQMGLLEAQQTAKNLETETGFAARESTLAMYERLGLSKEFLLNAQAELELDKLKAEEESKITNLKLKYIQDITAAQQIADETQKLAKLQSLQTVFEAEANSIATLSAMKQGDVSAKLKFDIDTTAIESLKSLFDELGTSLEGFGNKYSEALSGIVSTIGEVTIAQLESAKSIEDTDKAAKSAYDAGRYEEYFDLMDEGDKKRKKAEKDEITGTAKILGASKKLFKEKTVAYKVLDAAEKAMHAKKMAMFIAENAAELAKTAIAVSSSISRMFASKAEAVADGTAAVANQGKGDPYTAFARMAAMAAFVSSLLGSKVGGSGGGFVPSAEQQQEVQGTAMGYNSEGAKVQVRRGVFGDTDAKSESITNSLEIIRDNSIAGLSYDNKMLKALEAIERAISGVSKAAYRVSGLRTGDLFGTQTGVVGKGGGFLGTGLFGSKTSANVADTGILISGTFDQLSKGLSDSALQFYETVNYTKKKWYGSKKSWTETNRMAISAAQGGAELSAAIGGVFAESRNLINEIAAEAKMSQTTVDQILSTVKYDTQRLSTQGLRGEALKQEINSVISSMLDDATSAVFSSFEEYAEFGEGLLQTVVRVIDTNKKVKQSLRNMGAQDIETSIRARSPSMADEDVAQASFRITENLTNLSGGIEEFVERSTFFTDNFLTEELRLAPIREAVNTEMARIAKLGYTSADGLVDTKREFAELIGTLDLTQPAAQAVYVSLMDVAEGFSEVYEGTEALENSIEYYLDKLRNQKRTNEDIANSIFDMENETKKLSAELLKAQGNLDGYKQAIIAIETEGFHPLELAVYLSNQAIKDQIEALNKQEQASKDAANGLNSLLNQVVSLGNYSEDFRLQYTRNQALDKTVDALKPLQNYVFALEDVKTATTKSAEAKAAYLSALDVEIGKQKESVTGLKDTQKALKGFISSIRDFSSSLKLGTESILTPLEKYTLAQSKFQEILTTSLTSQDKELREQALGQLEGAASEFLSASREINASSIGYANDFNVVTDALSQLEGALGGQLTDTESALLIAESQLAVMEAQKSSLQEIAQTLDQAYTIWVTAESSLTSIKAAANTALAAAYQSAVFAGDTKTADILSIGAFAKGGLAQGWSLVGESGPELVDFSTPGRVYTAEDTFNSFNSGNSELVDLVQELTNEVKKLREQQNKETGALINATYDSQNKNSDKVVSAITDSSAEEIWQLKVSSGAKLV